MSFAFNYEDFAYVVFVAIAGTVVSEGLSWLLFYRTEAYKELSRQHEEKSKKLEKEKERDSLTSKGFGEGKGSASTTMTGEPIKEKGLKVGQLEDALKKTAGDLSRLQFRSTMASSVVMIALFWTLNSRMSGKIVAKLPFEPISFIGSITHRGIAGDDFTDCSAVFLYILLSLAIRQNVQKFLGFKAHKADVPSLFKFS